MRGEWSKTWKNCCRITYPVMSIYKYHNSSSLEFKFLNSSINSSSSLTKTIIQIHFFGAFWYTLAKLICYSRREIRAYIVGKRELYCSFTLFSGNEKDRYLNLILEKLLHGEFYSIQQAKKILKREGWGIWDSKKKNNVKFELWLQ